MPKKTDLKIFGKMVMMYSWFEVAEIYGFDLGEEMRIKEIQRWMMAEIHIIRRIHTKYFRNEKIHGWK